MQKTVQNTLEYVICCHVMIQCAECIVCYIKSVPSVLLFSNDEVITTNSKLFKNFQTFVSYTLITGLQTTEKCCFNYPVTLPKVSLLQVIGKMT